MNVDFSLRDTLIASNNYEATKIALHAATTKRALGAVARYIDSDAFDRLPQQEKEDLIDLYTARLKLVTGAFA